MNIAIRGFPSDTTEDEIRTALEEYGVPVERLTIHPSDDQNRFLAVVSVDTNQAGIKVLAQKINGQVWKGQQLSAEYFLYR
jgi:hypothetical protein